MTNVSSYPRFIVTCLARDNRTLVARTASIMTLTAALVMAASFVPAAATIPPTQPDVAALPPSDLNASNDQQQKSLPALEEIGRCVSEQKRVQVLLVLDESGSLKKTDPKHQRVTAAKTAIESLASLAEHEIDGIKPDVEAAVAGFSVGYEEITGWASVNYGSIAAFNTSIDALVEKNKGVDTDYAAALIGARASFDNRAKANASNISDNTSDSTGTKANPCRAILWFTDGKYDIASNAKRDSAPKVYAPEINRFTADGPKLLLAAGKSALCRPGGLVDSLRKDGIANIALGLTAGLKPEDQGFLSALTTGTAPAVTKSVTLNTEPATAETVASSAPVLGNCGSIDGTKLGAFIPINNLSELVASLDTIASVLGYGVQGIPQADMAICPANPCTEGERKFPVDVGMSRFRLTAQTSGDDISVVLRSPSGAEVFAPSAGQTELNRNVGTAFVRSTWLANDVVSFDVTLPPANEAWVGPWSLTFVRPAGAVAFKAKGFRIFYFGGATVRFVDPSQRVLGSAKTKAQPNGLPLQVITGPNGVAVSPRFEKDTEVSFRGVLRNPSGTKGPLSFVTPEAGNPQAVWGKSANDGNSGDGSGGETVVKEKGAILSIITITKTKSGFVLTPTRTSLKISEVPTIKAESSSFWTYVRFLVVALLGLWAGILAWRWNKKKYFQGLGEVQVCVGAIRVARDQIAQSRIVWKSDVGAESVFRLNANQFAPLPATPVKTLSIGRVGFVRSKLGATASDTGSVLVFGEGKGFPNAGAGSLEVPGSLSPLWIFAGVQASLKLVSTPGSLGSGVSSVSTPGVGGSGVVGIGNNPSSTPTSTGKSGLPTVNLSLGTQPVDPAFTAAMATAFSSSTGSSGAAAVGTPQGPGSRNDQVFEGQLLVAVRDTNDIARLERHILDALAQSLFGFVEANPTIAAGGSNSTSGTTTSSPTASAQQRASSTRTTP
jgi:von Willebrand factor type A domain